MANVSYRLQWSIITIVLLSLSCAIDHPKGRRCGPAFGPYYDMWYMWCTTSPDYSEIVRGFDLSFKPNDSITIAGANSPICSDLHLEPIPEFFHAKKIVITGCELTEGGDIGAIGNQIFAKNITELVLQMEGDLILSLGRRTMMGFEGLKSLTLESNNLRNVSADLLHDLKNLEILKLGDNCLGQLPPDFLNLPNLREIELTSNRIKVIEPTMFDKSTKLVLLNIWNNEIVEIKPNSFDKLEYLKTLDIHNNNLTSLPDNIFSKLPNLRNIYLSHNNFTGDSLSENLLRNNSLLQVVTLSENKQSLITLPSKFFANFKHLTIIEIKGSGLIRLPEDLLVGAVSLRNLDMGRNYIETIPLGLFQDCINLSTLDLSVNELRDLPDGVFSSLNNLESLDLSKNHITMISENIFRNMSSLKILNLESNELKTIHPRRDKSMTLEFSNVIPDIFNEMKNIKIIKLSNTDFPENSLSPNLLRNNILLEEVIFSGNRRNLTTMPPKFFADLKTCRIINISSNGLIHLPEDLLMGTSSLQNLTIDRNYLEIIPNNILKDCRNLSTINLSWNRLKDLPDNVFSMLDKLQLLDLSRNHITNISKNIFSGLSSLKVLNLENNDIKIIHKEGLRSLKSLEIAKFSSNKLSWNNFFGGQSPFYHCVKTMRELYLSHNNISELYSDLRWPKNLKILDLSHNRLSVLSDFQLNFKSRNVYVDYSYNQIRMILLKKLEEYALNGDYSDYNGWKNITVSIGNNPIKCDCNIYDLLRYNEGRMHSNVNEIFHIGMNDLKCYEPDQLANVTVQQLESKSLKCLVKNSEEWIARCPESCECWKRVNDRTYIVDCSYRGIKKAPEVLIKPPDYREIELNLTGNLLTTIPAIRGSGYDAVTVLSLSQNLITEVSFSELSENLRVLNLDFNNLRKLDPSVLGLLMHSKNLTNLTLHGNPWIGDCNAREFLNFVQMKMVNIPELKRVAFKGSDLPVFEMTPEELCPLFIGWVIGISIGIAALGLIVGCLAAFYYRYQHEIKVWLYARHWCLWFVSEDELDKDKLYDAFICYSHKDRDFVENTLIPKLENVPNSFTICYHERDWKGGQFIPEQIVHSVEESRRTVVVLSPDFLNSVWGKMEFRTAHGQALSEGRARVIVILYRDIGPTDKLDHELKAYLSMNTYIKWGDPWFWDKLNYALPHRDNSMKREGKIMLFDSQQPVTRFISSKCKSIVVDDSYANHKV